MKKIISAITFIALSVVLLGCPTNPTTTDEEINENGSVVTPTNEITYHNVRFIDNGVLVSTIEVADGSTIDETDVPTPTEREYCDSYWRAEDAEHNTDEFDFTTSITSDVTLVSDYYVHYVEVDDVESINGNHVHLITDSSKFTPYRPAIGNNPWVHSDEDKYSYIDFEFHTWYNNNYEYRVYRWVNYDNTNIVIFKDTTEYGDNYNNYYNHGYIKNVTFSVDSDSYIIVNVVFND